MIATPVGQGSTAFAIKPELILLALGVLATILIMAVFFWLIRGMIREDRLANEESRIHSPKSTIDSEESP